MKTFQQKLGTNSIAYSGMASNVPVAIAEIEDKKVWKLWCCISSIVTCSLCLWSKVLHRCGSSELLSCAVRAPQLLQIMWFAHFVTWSKVLHKCGSSELFRCAVRASQLYQIIYMSTSIDKVQPVHMPLNICGSKHKATSKKTRVPTPDLKAKGVELSLFMLCSCYPSCLIQNGHRTLKTLHHEMSH